MKNGLSGNGLKIIALITMTMDHVGLMLFPQSLWLRMVGRLAFPLYAYMIAEGCRYTKSMPKYWGSVAAVGLVCQLVYWFAMGSLYMCIMVNFSLSIALIALVKKAVEERNGIWYAVLTAAVLGAFLLCEGLPLWLPHTDFAIDYGFVGVMLPVLIYLGSTAGAKLALAAVGLVLLAVSLGGIQWYSLLALPLLALYSGQRGKWKMKWLFYLYYPAHLVVLYALTMVR